MGNKPSKTTDYFSDLVVEDLEQSSQDKDSDYNDIIEISSDISSDSLDDLSFNKPKTPDLAPPPPIGKNGPQVIKQAQSNTVTESFVETKNSAKQENLKQKVENLEDYEDSRVSSDIKSHNEDSLEENYTVEASEIFSSELLEVRKHNDNTQKLPMAEPFDVVPISSHEKFKSNPKNMGDIHEHLKSSNYLEVAQNRVLELEKEVQKLRRDSEQLSAAGKHFKELTDTLKSQVKQAESNYFNLQDIAKEEKKILMQSLEAKEIKISALQERVIDVEQRQGSNHENVRIRERELENRLEIMKSENEALTQSKDEMILELKKQMTTVNSDIEKYRLQNQKMMAKFESKEELLRRTVKALRIALIMLEGSQVDED